MELSDIVLLLIATALLVLAVYLFWRALIWRREFVNDNEDPENKTDTDTENEDDPKAIAQSRAIWSWVSAFTSLILIAVATSWWWQAILVLAVITAIYVVIFWKPIANWIKITGGLISVAMLVLSIVSLVFAQPNATALDEAQVNESSQSTGEDATVTPAVNSGCPAEFIQSKPLDDGNYRVDGHLETEVAKFLLGEKSNSLQGEELRKAMTDEVATLNAEKGNKALPSDELLQLLISRMGHSTPVLVSLAIWTELIDVKEENNPEYFASLVTADGTCLSEKGEVLFHETSGALRSKVEEVSLIEEIPDDVKITLHNSGYDNEKIIISDTPGVEGYDLAFELKFKNGKTLYILVRCNNLLFSYGDSITSKMPKGPTDNPPLTPPPGPTPDPGKGTNNPPSEHGFDGDTSTGGDEKTPPQSPTGPANPGTNPVDTPPKDTKAPHSGGSQKDNNDLNKETKPDGGVTVKPETSGTTPSGGTPTTTDSGSGNVTSDAPAD